jgi:hypothetical protein
LPGQRLSIAAGRSVDVQESAQQHLRGERNVVAQEPHPAFDVSVDGRVSEGLMLCGWVAFVLGEERRCPAPVQLGLCSHRTGRHIGG